MKPLLAAFVLVVGLAACHPTGDPRCDRYPDPIHVITDAGWSVNCNPPFAGYTPDGMKIAGWADSHSRTVWVWPDHTWHLHRTLWHEAGHVLGMNEAEAEAYAYCMLPPNERSWTDGPLPSC